MGRSLRGGTGEGRGGRVLGKCGVPLVKMGRCWLRPGPGAKSFGCVFCSGFSCVVFARVWPRWHGAGALFFLWFMAAVATRSTQREPLSQNPLPPDVAQA